MKLNVHTAQQQYDIVLAPHIIQDLGELVRAVSGATDVAVITDTNVGPAYATAVCEQLCKCGFDVFPLTVPAGETSKCIEQAAALWGALRMRGIGRDGLVVALGGGVVGDLAGFVASTYMRGIPFIQVPTSLLAMVDSSIGGKTAIDLDDAKNIVGTFYQPSLVLADTDTLKTLPQSEWLNGFAEIAKCAVIDGGEAYEWLSNNADKLYA
ncbi:MAG: 3-dehydroquinate synthase, partial [Coriobacteriales bacterium]|nr:3-dehydroquinate synthase [Coriobacteriales bacterium]